MSIESFLKKSLRDLNQSATFDIHDIKSSLFRCSKPLIKQHEDETACRHRLILVSTETTGFLCGLETYEYILSKEGEKDSHIIYISKVDTTTTSTNYKGLTGRVVQAYISSLPPATSIFVFARAQPQYLFAKSAENKCKAVLSDRDLVSWWLSVLNKVPRKCTGWWSVPGIDDMSSALIEIGARKRGWTSSDKIKWNYGTSYASDAEASLVIPRFDDDAKSRLLKSTAEDDDKLTVADFWNLLAIGEECGSGKITGFFELKLDDNMAEEEQGQKEEKKSNLKNFTVFWNKFMSLDFSSEESIIQSTTTAKKDVQDIFPKLEIIQIKVETLLKNTTNNANIGADKRPAVNMLSSGFIKRKKV
jgi:hypothetical protein